MEQNLWIDQELKSIQKSIFKMFNHFSDIFSDLKLSFQKKDFNFLKSVKQNYTAITLARHRVTEKIIWKITKQGMMSIDLRFNMANVVIMEILVDSARIAYSLSKFLPKASVTQEFYLSIQLLLQIVLEMIHVCERLLVTGNLKLLSEMILIENKMNEVYDKKAQGLMTYLKQDLNSELRKNALKTYSQFHHLERVCDNLIRVGKWFFYSKKAYFCELKK